MVISADERLLRAELASTIFEIKFNTWSIDLLLFPSLRCYWIDSVEMSFMIQEIFNEFNDTIFAKL
jgi:hypothetical protein